MSMFVPLSNLVSMRSGNTPSMGNQSFWGGDMPWVSAKDFGGSRISSSSLKLTAEGRSVAKIAQENDLLLLVRGNLKKGISIAICDREIAFNQDVKCLTCSSEILSEYLLYYIQGREAEIFNLLGITGHGVAKLDTDTIKNFEVLVLPLIEQQKIVEILSDCDTAIEQISSKLAHQKRQIASLNRTIFAGLDCEMVALDKISSKITRRNDGNNHPVMTISGANGFLLQSDKYSREMSGQSLEKYTLLERGEFAYNKGNSNSFPQGCIYQLEQETAVVPFVYVSFSLDNGLNTDFYKHLFLSGYLNRQLARLINSGVRNDGLLNINPTDFFTCKVPVPSDEKQRKIADIFENMDALVKNLENQLTLLKTQKRGLMQQLLTGKLRVKGAA